MMIFTTLLAYGAFVAASRDAPVFSPADLQPLLSDAAEVYLPGSEGFANATFRWSAAIRPEFDVIVKVKTEADVRRTIRFANKYKRPFLAISGSHGQASTLGDVRNGIGIWMRGMNSVRIVDHGKAAVVGGGIQTGELLPALWDQGKQTTTTGCDCTGFVAPLLGGGHGWLQGRYGLVSDNLIHARVVLANGTALSVSRAENEELFWAIRGAGHNFGVFTELKIRIYDRKLEQDHWTVTGFTFTHDKLERAFAISNEWLAAPKRPVQLTHFGVFLFNPAVDADMPVFTIWLYWQGTSIPSAYTDPLYALSPASVISNMQNLTDVNTNLGASYGLPACAKGQSKLQYGVSLDRWSLENLRATMQIFASLPTEFRASVVFLEAYATNRVKELPNSGSYPDRQGELLVGPVMVYPNNASLDETAFGFGSRMRGAMLKNTGKPLLAYVNYARGDEKLEEIYGHEHWRLKKLKKLKAEYDPFGRFNFYAPIR